MESRSNKNISEKVIFSNINTKKNKDLPNKGLLEKTVKKITKK